MLESSPRRLDDPTLLITCPRGWEAEARQELRRLLPDARVRSLFIGGNIIVTLGGELQAALDAIAAAETRVIARVTPVQLQMEIGPGREWLDRIQKAAEQLGPADPDRRFMVAVDRRGHHDFTSHEIALAVADAFVHDGRPPVDLEAPEQVVSVEVFQELCYLGIGPAKQVLRKPLLRMRRWAPGERPVSRAEMKLREAIGQFNLALPVDGRALDIGAAPGGWTRVLAGEMAEVVAVDPGKLHERVLELANVTHIRCRADELDPEQIGVFDLLTNDMNMNPRESAELMCSLAPLLRPGGRAIMTIKFTTRQRGSHIEDARGVLKRCYGEIEVARMPHNSMETTAVMSRR